jgi:hypothetical protein
MFESVQEVRDRLAPLLSTFEPRVLAPTTAVAVLDLLTEIKNLAAAGEAMVAVRVAETDRWQGGSDRSAAHWLARRTGTSVGEARAKLETVEKLAELPATAEAFRSGRLSEQQVRHVADGASADPDAESELLDLVGRESLKQLQIEARRAQAVDDEAGRQARIHRRRSLRAWSDPDGTFRLSLSTTAAAGSQLLTALEPFKAAAYRAARAEGRHESFDAYAADGLLAMANAAGTPGDATPRSNVKAILVVDVAALKRGEVEHGETCEIRGVGPVSVAQARELLCDATLAVIVKDGVAIQNVTHLKRKTTAHQRTVLEYLGLVCVEEGCDRTDIEIDHTIAWALRHHTRIDELAARCHGHHRDKTEREQEERRRRQRAKPRPRDEVGSGDDRGPDVVERGLAVPN